MPRHATITSFRSGQSGNPTGRRPGTRNKVTTDAREAASRLVDDPEYRASLRQRMIDGTAGGVELLMWYYAKGRPVRPMDDSHGALDEMTNSELRGRLLTAIKTLDGRGEDVDAPSD
jgi:hypothetical protein